MQFYIDPGSQFTLRGLDFGRIQYFTPLGITVSSGGHNFAIKSCCSFSCYRPSPKCDENVSVLLIRPGILHKQRPTPDSRSLTLYAKVWYSVWR